MRMFKSRGSVKNRKVESWIFYSQWENENRKLKSILNN
jgi:hypothetical protein